MSPRERERAIRLAGMTHAMAQRATLAVSRYGPEAPHAWLRCGLGGWTRVDDRRLAKPGAAITCLACAGMEPWP